MPELKQRILVRTGLVWLAGYTLLSAGFIGLGTLMTDFGVESWLGDVDSAVVRGFARNRAGPLNAVADVFSNWADTWSVVLGAIGAAAVALPGRHWRQAAVLMVALALEISVFLSVTYVVQRQRPTVDPLASVPATASFPSGHMAAGTVLFGSFVVIVWSLWARRPVRIAVAAAGALAALAVGVSRIYLGLHYPTDVLAGAVLGICCLSFGVVAARAVPVSSLAADDRPEPPVALWRDAHELEPVR